MITQNSVCWFADTKVYLLLTFFVVGEERETVGNESTALERQREINRRRTRDIDADLDIILRSRWGTPSQSTPKLVAAIFGLSSHLRGFTPTLFFYFFYPSSTLTALTSKFLPVNHCSLSICCWGVFLSLTWASIVHFPIRFSHITVLLSLSQLLSLSYCLESLSHIRPSFSTVF